MNGKRNGIIQDRARVHASPQLQLHGVHVARRVVRGAHQGHRAAPGDHQRAPARLRAGALSRRERHDAAARRQRPAPDVEGAVRRPPVDGRQLHGAARGRGTRRRGEARDPAPAPRLRAHGAHAAAAAAAGGRDGAPRPRGLREGARGRRHARAAPAGVEDGKRQDARQPGADAERPHAAADAARRVQQDAHRGVGRGGGDDAADARPRGAERHVGVQDLCCRVLGAEHLRRNIAVAARRHPHGDHRRGPDVQELHARHAAHHLVAPERPQHVFVVGHAAAEQPQGLPRPAGADGRVDHHRGSGGRRRW